MYAVNVFDCRAIFLWLCSKDLTKLNFDSVQKGSPEEILMNLQQGLTTYAVVFEILCRYLIERFWIMLILDMVIIIEICTLLHYASKNENNMKHKKWRKWFKDSTGWVKKVTPLRLFWYFSLWPSFADENLPTCLLFISSHTGCANKKQSLKKNLLSQLL